MFIFVGVVLISIDCKGVFVGVLFQVFRLYTAPFVCTSPVFVRLVQGSGF